ncbi:MAG: hypothetical protein U0Q08_02015 [Dermatophilaceae bacterium]
MCSPALCSTCGKTTYRGCGQRVDQIRARVPEGQWCTCAETPAPAPRDLSSWLPGR